jgi:ubiquinone/menaquinone biosynthesis C-methylase UbiE
MKGAVLTELGHSWVGVDISPSMLAVARAREVEVTVTKPSFHYYAIEAEELCSLFQ